MNLEWVLFSFRGRLSRLPYWIGTLISVVVMAGVMVLLSSQVHTISGWGIAVCALLFAMMLWAVLALASKRLRDRGKGFGWLAFYLLLPPAIEFLGGTTGSYGIAIAVSLVSIGISIAGLIDMGFLRGTRGANRFGGDPLERPAA
jgi:uncharacterized membrane protein YhaH (DUF805 family)